MKKSPCDVTDFHASTLHSSTDIPRSLPALNQRFVQLDFAMFASRVKLKFYQSSGTQVIKN